MKLIAERFEVEERSATGGMATVYRTRDRTTGNLTAVKVLHCGAERFELEARVLAELTHPAIVRYVAHGATNEGEPFLAMEWLEGQDLSTKLEGGGLDLADTLILFERVCEALTIAHRRGIVHRDIKPSNIFLPGGRVTEAKLLDFGIARRVGSGLTSTGVAVGTPGYMAPEQARGDAVDARADVFSLGCVLFECVTGAPAFKGEHVMAILAKILLHDPPRLRELNKDVPHDFQELVSRMLSKQAFDRPADAMAALAMRHQLGPVPLTMERAIASSAMSAGLTVTERRVVCLVLAPAPSDDAAALASSSIPPESSESAISYDPTMLVANASQTLAILAHEFGVHLERLRDGSVVVTVSGGSATDLASRAARFALAMRARVPGLPIVVVTGRADVTRRLPVGQAIDRGVALLNGLASEVGVRLDAVTAGLLDLRFEVVGNGDALFLRSEREVAEGARTLLGRPTPFVGRDRDLRTLDGLFDECRSESVARAVLITAGAGIGKSRLRLEFLGRIATPEKPVEILVGRGDPMSVGSPFALLARAVRRAAGIVAGERIDGQRAKLAARLARHIHDEEDLARITDFIGEFAGIRGADENPQLRAARNSPRLMNDLISKAWTDWLAAECAAQPVVVVLEDLQWGDLPSVKLIESALRALGDAPLMVLALARPEVHELFPGMWRGRSLTELHLGELSARACESLAREVLGAGVPDETIARVVSRADGNAFYLEELVRAIADRRGDSLPFSVLGMVEARLEALEPEARRVLRAGAVFGKTFTREGVHVLLGGAITTSAVAHWLDDLVEREMLERRDESLATGDTEFQFRHGLVRETAYGMLTDADRTLGHRLAGEWLARDGFRDAAVLAEHFVRGQNPGRAIECYLRAADQALEGNDLAKALELAEHGVACGAEGEVLGALRLVEAEAHNWCGRFGDGEPAAVGAVELLAPGEARWYRAVAELVTARGRLGRYGRVAAWAKRLLATKPGPEVAGAAEVCGARIVRELLDAGLYDLSEPLFEAIRPQASKDPAAGAWVQCVAALRALSLGNPGNHLALMQSAATLFEAAGDVRNACEQRSWLADAYVQIGMPERAKDLLVDVLASGERMGLTFVIACAKHTLGLTLARLGDLDGAIATERQAIALFIEQSDRRMEGASRSYLATILALRGDLPAAEVQARSAARILAVAPPLRAEALATLARVLTAQNRHDEAIVPATAAADALVVRGVLQHGDALVRLAHAEALRHANRTHEAINAIQSARDSVMRRALTIVDLTERRAFLHHVPEHAEILALAAETISDTNDD
jgi:serine/threonine protein kinase/tetratricopeptide (TPR) repeat protein